MYIRAFTHGTQGTDMCFLLYFDINPVLPSVPYMARLAKILILEWIIKKLTVATIYIYI